ncbi:MAG TPA: DUF1214 domain-containing protein [Microthrixaceae bacterium]|nr:DUF1214 domain-containing protein [Microthrixaceae bacterium]
MVEPARADDPVDPRRAWAEFVDRLRIAGERVGAAVDGLGPIEAADGYRALLRALNNQLGRFEVDRERPELVPFNGWREKFLMDNPDFRYWVADIRDDRRYRIVGAMGSAVYLSVTAYAARGLTDTSAAARIDSDALEISADGSFELTLSRDRPDDGQERAWLELPEGATSVWVRLFHDGLLRGGADADRLGWCRIEPIDDPPAPPPIDPARFVAHLARSGSVVAHVPRIIDAATAEDLAAPNTVRHWSEMTGGAAFTEPGIHYLRGAWQLDAGEALVVEGDLVPCRYWNLLLYSRFLNSLDHRHRVVSRTAATSTLVDGHFRFVLAGERTDGDWLDTEGRPFGIFVMRFLQPARPPDLPTVRRLRLSELERAT